MVKKNHSSHNMIGMSRGIKMNTSLNSQIVLTTKNGKRLSIVQNHEIGEKVVNGDYGRSVEVWIDGTDNPSSHLNAEDLAKYLINNML